MVLPYLWLIIKKNHQTHSHWINAYTPDSFKSLPWILQSENKNQMPKNATALQQSIARLFIMYWVWISIHWLSSLKSSPFIKILITHLSFQPRIGGKGCVCVCVNVVQFNASPSKISTRTAAYTLAGIGAYGLFSVLKSWNYQVVSPLH